MKKKSFLEIMTGLIIFIFVLLIFCYFFFSIKKEVKNNNSNIFMDAVRAGENAAKKESYKYEKITYVKYIFK